jgi:uncharacterized protein
VIEIPPKSAHALLVRAGEILKVSDVRGSQVADFVCLSSEESAEYFSQARTRVNNWTTRLTVGHVLFSNRNQPMFRIAEDTVGVHDILFSPCSAYVYEHIYGVGPRDGCYENLARALQGFGISIDQVPDPFNIFMNTGIDEDYSLVIRRALSAPGDYVNLRAEMDCVVAVSACAADLDECNGGECTPIALEVIAT